jgi:hypothetical protein
MLGNPKAIKFIVKNNNRKIEVEAGKLKV